MASGKATVDAKRICAIAFAKRHGMTPQKAEVKGMMREPMASDWIQIFRAGAYPGKLPVSAEDLEAIARAYDPRVHEAPLCLGHPETDAPAYGWVEKLRRVGDALWAKARQISPELRRLVRDGAFKHISMAVYKDQPGLAPLYLRHVGFVGADVPAVKGMAPVRFKEGDYQAMDMEMPIGDALDQQDAMMRVLDGCYVLMDRVHAVFDDETIISKQQAVLDQLESLRALVEGETFTEGKGRAPMTFLQKLQALFVEAGVKVPGEEMPPAQGAGQQFTEAQVIEREKAAAARARTEAESQAAATAARAARLAEVKTRVTAFVEAGIAGGTFLPAWRKAGIPVVMEQLLLGEGQVTFAEGTPAQNAGEVLLAFLKGLPKLVTFDEIAASRRADPAIGAGSAAEKLDALIAKHMDEKKVGYSVAFVEVQKAHPELARQYADEARAPRG